MGQMDGDLMVKMIVKLGWGEDLVGVVALDRDDPGGVLVEPLGSGR